MMLLIGGFFVLAFFLYKCFGNVQTNVQRRMLQNFVYRLYQINTWFFSLIRGFDAAVGMYYTTMETTKIAPVNEKKFQPVILQAVKKEPIMIEAPKEIRSGWNWRKVVGG